MDNPDEIIKILETGLRASSLNQTKLTLGDRTSYLGISDLALAMSCKRKVITDKLKNGPFLFNLNEHLTLERRHWLEYGIEKALRATGVKLIPQLEISIIFNSTPYPT
jgi:hypothetical protein